MLILTSFEKALNSLEKAISRSSDAPEDEELRDSVIQRFEYTYELAWKMMKRYLESEGFKEVISFSKRDLFRKAAEIGLINEPESWFTFHVARNETSHVYDQNIASEVYSKACDFFKQAKQFYKELRKRNNA